MKRAHIHGFVRTLLLGIVYLPARSFAIPRVTQNISACLMVKDNNDKMVEWVAYHHFTLPLTRIVVCEEPDNQERVRDRFTNTVWEDMIQFDYLTAGVDFFNSQKKKERLEAAKTKVYNHTGEYNQKGVHRSLQYDCFEHCMQLLKSEGATWTLFLDTDEFLVPPPRPVEVHGAIPNVAKAQKFLQPMLNQLPFAGQACAFFPRVMFNNVTEAPDDLYTVRKYRQHTSPGSDYGKALLDVSQLTAEDMKHVRNPHGGISSACKRQYGNQPTYKKTPDVPYSLVVNHYTGSLESFLFQKGDKRFTDRRLMHLKKMEKYGFGTEVGQTPPGSSNVCCRYNRSCFCDRKWKNRVENDDNLILDTWMEEFELEWERKRTSKVLLQGNNKYNNVTFASLMNGLGLHTAGKESERTGTVMNKGSTGYGGSCGTRGVAFVKLHKVGSTTMSNAVVGYAGRWNLTVCPKSMHTDCDVLVEHKNTELQIKKHGLEVFLDELVPGLAVNMNRRNGGAPPVSVVVLRDPRERVLSRFFYDRLGGKQEHKSWRAFSLYLNSTKAKKEGRHYVDCLGSRKDHRPKTTAEAIHGLKKFEVLVVTSRMEAGIARVALALGCDAVNWTFHSQKRVLGRPTIDQAPPAVQEQLNALVAQDMAVWEAADTIAAEREALPDARAALTELNQRQGELGDDCAFAYTADDFARMGHNKHNLKNRDCFQYNH